jgi:hypothetical protein
MKWILRSKMNNDEGSSTWIEEKEKGRLLIVVYTIIRHLGIASMTINLFPAPLG